MNFKSENYFKALVDSLPDTVWSFDQEYILTAANTAFFELRYNTYQSNIKIGDSFFKDVTQAAIEKWKPLFEKVLNGERLIMAEERKTNGQLTFVELSLNPVLNDNLEVTGCMGITYDVTKNYQLEIAMNQARNVIDKLIRTTDVKLTPSITKIFSLSQQLSDTRRVDKDEVETVLYLLNSELVQVNQELSNLVSISKGAKNL